MKHAWVVLVAACGGSSPVELEAFGPAFAHALCEREFSCCTGDQVLHDFGNAMVNGHAIESEADCETVVEQLYAALDSQTYEPQVAAMGIRWDADAAGACVDQVAATSCGDFQLAVIPVGCPVYAVPQLADGAACKEDISCVSGWCTDYGDGDTGTCVVPPGAGEACTGTCAVGLVCHDTCVPPLQGGASCDRSDQCASQQCTDGACEAVRVCKGV